MAVRGGLLLGGIQCNLEDFYILLQNFENSLVAPSSKWRLCPCAA